MKTNLKEKIKALVSNEFLMFKGNPKNKEVALTFDDGPYAPNTEKILDILNAEKVKATFFLIGKEIDRYPEITKRICVEGHEIGIHSYTHSDFLKLSVKNIKEEIEKTRASISRITGFSTSIFRSPEGAINFKLLCYTLLHGIRLVQWSADIRDSFVDSKEELLNRFDDLSLKNGDIILLHDDSRYIIDSLPQIIFKIKEKGFLFTTISNFLQQIR